MSECTICKIEQTKTNTNLDNSRSSGFSSKCMECNKKYLKKYRKENRDTLLKKQKEFYYLNYEKCRKRQNEYGKSERGRERNRKSVQKYRSTPHGKFQRHIEHCRRKQYGYNKICENIFPDCIDIQWHHITDNDVIALPDNIHKETTGTNNIERHRKLALEWIEIFYPKEIYNSILERTSNF
jgi:hypothetical protein